MTDPGSLFRAQMDLLEHEIVNASATLSALRADIAQAEALLHSTESHQLLQANEQLVLAMLRAQGDAETAAAELVAASLSAERDALTRLPNRALLHDRWLQAVAIARRHGKKMALMFVDLDDFKRVNDSWGHATGDEVLVAMAARLTASVREADTVGRYGGDEFVVVLAEITSAADAAGVGDKLLAAMAAPLEIGGHALRVTASIGISVYPDDADDVNALLDLADRAMYAAKRQGGGVVQFRPGHTADELSRPLMQDQGPRQDINELEGVNKVLREANTRLVLAAVDAADLQETAERALERHRTYLALLGHEIRTPLSPLRYAAAALALGPLPDASLTRLRQTIERQVVQIARLVDDMLALSSASRARLDVERRPVDVVALVTQSADACRPSVEARQQRMTITADPATQVARVDPVRVVQIVTNLIDNASKYTPVEGRIVVSVAGTSNDVSVTVQDTGIGVALASVGSLFEPFVRAPEALASGSAGLGIGLTVVRELVAAHGGSVDVYSGGVGQGTEFIVRLPR